MTLISNPSGRASVTSGAHETTQPSRVKPSALEAMRGRVLLEATEDDLPWVARNLRQHDSGLVVGGAKALATVASLRQAFPEMVLAIDPVAGEDRVATVEAPFAHLGEGDGLFEVPLDEVLNGQILRGASFAVIPAAYVRVGEPDAFKAIVNGANQLDRRDAVLYIRMDYRWLRPENLKQTIAILSLSHHPIALALGDANGNPTDHPNILAGLRELVDRVSHVSIWRSDLVGLDAMKHGAQSACIGLIPSRRRAAVPGSKARSSDPRDHTPHLLLPDLLTWVRCSRLSEWFAITAAPSCACLECGGRALDRFGSSAQDGFAGRRHNAATVMTLLAEAEAHGGVDLWWPGKVADAVVAYETLSRKVGREIKPRSDVLRWAA